MRFIENLAISSFDNRCFWEAKVIKLRHETCGKGEEEEEEEEEAASQ